MADRWFCGAFFCGDLVTGKGASTDVIEASAKAYLNAVNRYLNTDRRKKKPRKTNGQP